MKLEREAKQMAIAKAVLSIFGFLLLASCDDNGPFPAPTPRSTVLMDAVAWTILYSPGMPPHPAPQTDGGWYFDFPNVRIPMKSPGHSEMMSPGIPT
jgi:hypothetical protein